MNTEAINNELDRRLANVAALNKAMAHELAAIERLKQQNQKMKTGIGAQVLAQKLAREEKAKLKTQNQ